MTIEKVRAAALMAFSCFAVEGLAADTTPQEDGPARPDGFPPWQQSTEPVLKEYPASRLAKADGSALDPLLRHLTQRKVPTTGPALHILDPDESQPEMMRIAASALFYPDPTFGEPGHDGNVLVENWQPRTVLSIGFTGAADLRTLRDKVEKLASRCHGRGADYTRIGPYRLLTYDGPSVPDDRRRHEVQAPVMTRAAWREYYLGRDRPTPDPVGPAVEEALESLAELAEDWGKPENLAEYERREKASRTIQYLEDVPPLQTPSELAGALRSGKRAEILGALRTMVRLGDDRMYQPVVTLLEHPDWGIRSAAAGGLGALGDPRAVPVLTEALEREVASDREYRRPVSTRMALALAQLGDELAVQPIRRALAEFRDHYLPPFSQRIRTLDGEYVSLTWPGMKVALAMLGEDDFLPTVRALARDNSMSPEGGIDVLVKMKDQRALDILVEQLGSESWGIRRSAVLGLAELGDEQAIPHLENLKDDDREEVRRAVRWALDQLAGN